MKKICFAIVAIIVAVMLGGNIYYTYKASKECGIVLKMTHNMENAGTIDGETAARYYHAIAKSRNVMYPVNTLTRLKRIHRNLRREKDLHEKNSAMGGQFEYAITTLIN